MGRDPRLRRQRRGSGVALTPRLVTDCLELTADRFGIGRDLVVAMWIRTDSSGIANGCCCMASLYRKGFAAVSCWQDAFPAQSRNAACHPLGGDSLAGSIKCPLFIIVILVDSNRGVRRIGPTKPDQSSDRVSIRPGAQNFGRFIPWLISTGSMITLSITMIRRGNRMKHDNDDSISRGAIAPGA